MRGGGDINKTSRTLADTRRRDYPCLAPYIRHHQDAGHQKGKATLVSHQRDRPPLRRPPLWQPCTKESWTEMAHHWGEWFCCVKAATRYNSSTSPMWLFVEARTSHLSRCIRHHSHTQQHKHSHAYRSFRLKKSRSLACDHTIVILVNYKAASIGSVPGQRPQCVTESS